MIDEGLSPAREPCLQFGGAIAIQTGPKLGSVFVVAVGSAMGALAEKSSKYSSQQGRSSSSGV